METVIHLRFLGTVQAEQSGEKIQGFQSRKALALVGYLAVQQQPSAREQLVDLLWSDQTESQGRANLSWVLNHVSKYLPGCVIADRHSIQIQRDGSYWLDIEAFAELEAQGDSAALFSAAALYRGEFLESLHLDGCEQFEIWLTGERERWHQRMVNVLQKLVTRFSLEGKYAQGLETANRLLELEPWHEETHRQVMHLLAHMGQRSAAIAQYETCCRILAHELDVEPSEETVVLFERIQAADSRCRHNLPIQPTPFVGREKELNDLIGLVSNPDCRLLTILGPGGIGKTRLALQSAEGMTDAFLEGICFVPLVGIDSPAYLVSAIADALQLPLSGAQPAQVQLLSYLRNKEMLLVLDNFEHLLEDVGLLEEILRGAPEVKLLVTSRGRLNMRWERCFEIEGLQYPTGKTTEKNLESYSAVQLLAQTASRVQRQFSLSGQNGPAAVLICQLVQGMPLGIELAAVWARTHTCREIAAEIEKDIGFLSTPLQDMPERHRSMRATFERSWHLLTLPEQDTFMQLSTFRGGFSREAAVEVAGASFDTLASLTDKSLIRFLSSGRYEMHELLRQYAAEKLAVMPQAEALAHDRHCAYFTKLLQCQEPNLTNGVAGTLTMVRAEVENIRAAWHWAVSKGKMDEIGYGLAGLSSFYFLAGFCQEGRSLIETAIEYICRIAKKDDGTDQDAKVLLSNLLIEQAHFLNAQGLYDQAITVVQMAIGLAQDYPAANIETRGRLRWAEALRYKGCLQDAQLQLERGLDLAQASHLEQEEAECLRLLGIVCHITHHHCESLPYYEQSLSIYRKIGNHNGENAVLSVLGLLFSHQGDYAKAKSCQEQALHLSGEGDNRWGSVTPLINLGYVCHQMGDYVAAKNCYRRTLLITREIGDLATESLALSCLCLLSHHLKDNGAAYRYGRRALAGAQAIGERRVLGYALTRLGHALAGLGRFSEAIDIYRQAQRLRQELGQHNLAMESLAGLARVSLAQGLVPQAQAQVQEILNHLETGTLEGADEPFLIYLSCYHVLQANHDPRAKEVLSSAHNLLQEQAARIDDKELRRIFLENIAAHREIVEIVEREESILDRVG